MRLGLYIDAVYRRADGDRVLTTAETLPFLRFGCEVGTHFDALVLFGREAPAGAGADLPLPVQAGLAPLPWYPSLAAVPKVAAAAVRTVGAMWRGLGRVDAVWVFGPHPFGLLLALLALVRRRRVVLGVRQDTMRYFRSRLRRRGAAPLLAPLWVLDRAWKLLARLVPATVVGEELERRYGGPRRGLLPMQISLIPSGEVASAPRIAPLAGTVSLLTVGRLDAEKNPLLLVEALAALGPGFRAVWLGAGPLAGAVRARAEELEVELELPGFVEPGPALLARYRSADAFVHVALTEGVPQVLMEALACGTPVVATAVGGLRSLVADGETGFLVAERDPVAFAAPVSVLLDAPDVAHEMGLAAQARSRRYSWSITAGRLRRLYADVSAREPVQCA